MYGAKVVRRQRGKTRLTGIDWFLVNDGIYEDRNEPFIHVKSDFRKMIQSIDQVVIDSKKGSNKIKVWANGQGIRTIGLDCVDDIRIVPIGPR